MNELRLGLLQYDIAWEDKENNYSKIDSILPSKGYVDLLVLPEMFNTGFSMNTELADEHCGSGFQRMKQWAIELESAIVGSVMTRDEGEFYNRLYFVFPDGTFEFYDKKHLFSYAKEDAFYTPGQKRVIVKYKDWKIACFICYDLRFPVWTRNVEGYDMALFIANWPERRSFPWKSLLIARAIENLSFVVGLNRVGDDGNGIYHSGNSAVLDPLGQYLAELSPGEEEFRLITIQKEHLLKIRDRFRFLDDQDQFKLLD